MIRLSKNDLIHYLP